MDENQRLSLLRAIAISSGTPGLGPVTASQRSEAFTNLEQFKKYDSRVAACIDLIGRDSHSLPVGGGGGGPVDVTAPTKLYALMVLQGFLRTGYARLGEADRLALRTSVVTAAWQLATMQPPSAESDAEARMLGMKIATLIADVAVRDFPQRWTTFFSDLFVPVSRGGIWCEPGSTESAGTMTGLKIGLECLKLITEDCTDSDFNAKISTSRRNDILIGLNEVSNQFLPLLFALLSEQYSIVSNAKSTLHDMQAYLASNGRNVAQMTPDEKAMYDQQVTRRDLAGRLVTDTLTTLEKFCQSMPIDWMLSAKDGCDFVPAMLHLLREDVASIQVISVACLEQLSSRKLEFEQWMQFISSLPQAISEANQAAAQRENERAAGGADRLIEQLPFHRALSKMMAHLISAHLAHITTPHNGIIDGKGPRFQSLSAFLHLLSEMLSHPSGRICGEQINTWIAMLRDPSVVKTKILSPYMSQVLTAYMNNMVRIRWEDVEEQNHPLTALMEASWDDKEEYDSWLCDLRSKASQLFKYISNSEPKLSASIIDSKLQSLLTAHSNGEPRDHLDPGTNQVTQKSEAVMQFEGIYQPLDNILQGIPSWAVKEGSVDAERAEIRASVRASLSQLANMIVSWNPSDTWLKFRRTTLLDALKYYWRHDPTTLANGVDALLQYLTVQDQPPSTELSGDVISLRKKCGVSLVSVSKRVPHLLVPWLAQLSERAKTLLASNNLLPSNQMHLYEFLSCVATAVEDPAARSSFVADVLSNALNALQSAEVMNAISSTEGLMSSVGIIQASSDPASVTNPENVKRVTSNYVNMFSAINQLLSVGKRCHEAAKKRPNGGIPLQNIPSNSIVGMGQDTNQNFPDEGPVSISDLSFNDPFVPLWPKILPTLIKTIDAVLGLWHPEYQAVLLQNNIQRYALAISDDEAYLATKKDSSTGGVFGEGGTAGSIVSGFDRRDMNLAPKWSGWFNELRNTCFQMLGLLAAQRALYAPEIAAMFPQLVSTLVNPAHMRAMEHRHFTQYMKQFIEILMVSCPSTMYVTHLSPLLGPLFEHLQYRMQCSWAPIITPQGTSPDLSKPLMTPGCANAAALASQGGDAWFVPYYARGGLFVGDLDSLTGETAVEKVRVELGRSFSDMLQSALALKGDWALVLANQAKEDQAAKRNDSSKLTSGPRTRISEGGPVNADGTPRSQNQTALEARKSLRIHKLCHFLLLEDEKVAGFLVMTVIQCLGYPDAYTCRRCARICHRILETAAWVERYTQLLGSQMFLMAAKAIVTEPKWMVGIEWDMINLLRDIYCRLVLGQTLLPGGQGPGMQQPRDAVDNRVFEQAKTFDNPLQGGGVLRVPSDLPRQILAGLPGIGEAAVTKLDGDLTEKRSAKDQKDVLRDVLRVAADSIKESEVGIAESGILGRAVAEESLLNQNIRKSGVVPDLPEKLVTYSMLAKKEATNGDLSEATPALGQLFKLS